MVISAPESKVMVATPAFKFMVPGISLLPAVVGKELSQAAFSFSVRVATKFGVLVLK